jgi:Arc/MetJ family transcription regulator
VYISNNYTHLGNKMRTNIVIDDKLMEKAIKLSGLKTKREVVDEALKRFIQIERQKEFRKLKGKIKWEGNLDEMRSMRW